MKWKLKEQGTLGRSGMTGLWRVWICARQVWTSLDSSQCTRHSSLVPPSLPPRPQLIGSEIDNWPKANQWPDSQFQLGNSWMWGASRASGPVHVLSHVTWVNRTEGGEWSSSLGKQNGETMAWEEGRNTLVPAKFWVPLSHGAQV